MSIASPTAELPATSPSRARHAVIAVLIQLIVSVVYSWSVLRGPLAHLYGWTRAQTIAPYRYTLISVALGAVLGGLWQDRKGSRIVATFGGLMLAAGCFASYLYGDTVTGLIVGYGIIGGIGGGFAYVTPIANLVKWFPDKRGMMVGLAVMGSGMSPLFWSPLIERFIGKDASRFQETVPQTFLLMAVIFAVVLVGAAQFYRVPPEGWTQPGGKAATIQHQREISSKAMLATWQFYVLWLIFFLGASVGLTAIGQASPLISEVSHLDAPISAGVAVGIMGVFNALGRLGWGGLSDHFDRKLALYGMTAISVIACVGFLRTGTSLWSVLAGLCLAAFSYGGYLAVMPSLTADYYGQSSIGGNYGLVFSAWGLCGFLVPAYFEGLLDRAREINSLARGYNEVYWTLAILGLLVAGLTALLQRPNTRA